MALLGNLGQFWGNFLAVLGPKCFCIYMLKCLNAFVYTGLNAFVYTDLNAFV